MDQRKYRGTDEDVVQVSRLIERYKRALESVTDADIEKVVNSLMQAATVYTAGNGGSAEIASHFASDLRNVDVNAICLTDNIARLTALANDYSYDDVFVMQLRENLKLGDVLVVISSSGNSKNIVNAVEMAGEMNVPTIGFVGFRGGKVFASVSRGVHINADDYGEVEGAHSCLCHMITEMIAKKREAEGGL